MAHTLTDNKTLEEGWDILQSIMSADLQMLRDNFPNKTLLPTIGNNDVVVHNNVPCDDVFAQKYYQGLFDIWFPKDHQPQNFDQEKAHKSFLQGGYYKYDFKDHNTSLIALNTMYFNKKNICQLEKAKV